MADKRLKFGVSKPRNVPWHIEYKGTICYFDGIAPITKDCLYSGTRNNGERVNAMLCNKDPYTVQQAYLSRA